jgi:uncharacterized membrane protein HdeD (DUF308 family)
MESLVERTAQTVESDLKRVRWALGISGVLSVAFGVVILIWPGISLYALVILFGAFSLANGIVNVATAITGSVKQGRGWLAVLGLLGIAVGVVVFLWTGMSALALLYVIGVYAVLLGLITIAGAFWLPFEVGDRALFVLTGLVSILFGIVMFAKPGDGALVLLALIAAFALVTGVSELVVAIGGKRLLERDIKGLSNGHGRSHDRPPPHRARRTVWCAGVHARSERVRRRIEGYEGARRARRD